MGCLVEEVAAEEPFFITDTNVDAETPVLE